MKIDSNHFVATQNSTWGYTQNGWGTIPASKKIINANADTISCAFSEIKEFINGYAEATIGDRHGKIDIDGHMQENIVSIYGNLRLFEQFENYYFKNENDERVSEEFQKVEQLYGQFFSVKKRGESNDIGEYLHKLTDSDEIIDLKFITSTPNSRCKDIDCEETSSFFAISEMFITQFNKDTRRRRR